MRKCTKGRADWGHQVTKINWGCHLITRLRVVKKRLEVFLEMNLPVKGGILLIGPYIEGRCVYSNWTCWRMRLRVPFIDWRNPWILQDIAGITKSEFSFTEVEFLFHRKLIVFWMFLSGHCLMNSNYHCSWIVICPLAFLENYSLHSDWYCGMNSVLFGNFARCGYCSLNSNRSQTIFRAT